MCVMLLAGGSAVPQASPFCTLCPVGTFSPGGRQGAVPYPVPSAPHSAPGSSSSCLMCLHPHCMPSRPDCTTRLQFQAVNAAAGQALAGPAPQQQAAARSALWARLALEKACSPALPCGFGSTSPEGSDAPTDCYPVDQCPVGMWVVPGSISDPPSSAAECICKEGYGGEYLVHAGIRQDGQSIGNS